MQVAQHASGLYVPTDLARPREVWTRAEKRTFEKAVELIGDRGIGLMLRCDAPDCPDRALITSHTDTGEMVMRCGCKDRVFSRAW